VSLGLLICVPFCIFALITATFTFVYHFSPAVTWTVVALCLGVAVLLLAVKNKKQGGPMYWVTLGALSLVALVAGVSTGLWNHDRHMASYWAYEGQREYTNVLPSEPALAHLDAGRIIFSADSHLDKSKSVGYKIDGYMYCVAPIVGSDPSKKIEYWAASVDCCGQRGDFRCDAYDDPKAHAGLVLPGARADLDKLLKAAREAAAAFGLQASPDSLFVQWAADPGQAQRHHYRLGAGLFVGACAAYLLLSVAAGLFVHLGQRPPKSKFVRN